MCRIQRIKKFFGYFLSLFIIISMVACSSGQVTITPPGDTAKLDTNTPEQEAYTSPEDSSELDNLPQDNTFGEIKSNLIPIISELNAFTVDFSLLLQVLEEATPSTEFYLFNIYVDGSHGREQHGGFIMQFDMSGSVANIWLFPVSPTVTHADLDYSFYWLRGLNHAAALPLPSDALILDKQRYLRNIQLISKADNPMIGNPKIPPIISLPECLSFSAFAEAYSASMIEKIVRDYTVGTPSSYILTSALLSEADIDKLGGTVTFLSCSGETYKEMNTSEVAAITDSAKTMDSGFLYLEGCWYLTLLPYYSDGIPYSPYSDEQKGILPLRELSNNPDSEMYSASNIVILCFPAR